MPLYVQQQFHIAFVDDLLILTVSYRARNKHSVLSGRMFEQE